MTRKIDLLRSFWVEQEEQACILQFIWSLDMGQPQSMIFRGATLFSRHLVSI